MAVRLSHESVCIGPGPSGESYLNMASILSAAEVTGADAIHPGFGFLSENANFASAVEAHGITFIGPKADHITSMGDKIRAKSTAQELGLKTIPGSPGPVHSLAAAKDIAEEIGYPVLIKAVAGGGGKGMRVVKGAADMEAAFTWAKSEAFQSFKNDDVYIEKLLAHPRHVEFQIIGDMHGTVVCLGERDCSLQRKHQKIWEEALCPVLSPEFRQKSMDDIVTAMQKMGYYNSGTLEFLYENNELYFMEMNTRLQVEHPITEAITGIDIVKEQILVAAGYPLSFHQKDVNFYGHAIECRINAEEPYTFFPSPGIVKEYLAPGGPFVRVDSALFSGYQIPSLYDSLVAKLIVWGRTRDECLDRLRKALDEYVITGIKTLIPLHRYLCDLPEIKSGEYDIRWLEHHLSSVVCEQ